MTLTLADITNGDGGTVLLILIVVLIIFAIIFLARRW